MAKVKEFLIENGLSLLFNIALLCFLFFVVFSMLCDIGIFGCPSFIHPFMSGYFCEFCGKQIGDLPVICPNCDTRLVHDFCSSCGWSVSGG